MRALEQTLSPAVLRALGWTLLHSLWQGALAAAVVAVALLVLRRRPAAVRYRVAAGALGALVLLAVATFGYYYGAPETVAAPAYGLVAPAQTTAAPAAVLTEAAHFVPSAMAASAAPRLGWLATARRHFDQNLPWLVLAWGLGLLVMSLRLLGGLLYVQRLRRHRTRPLPAAWQARLGGLVARAGLRRPVALLESGMVAAPLVVGHLRPLVLLPLGAVAGLPVACVEAILAHELAHVLRRDYLVNLLQTVAETVFFYHPAVWYLGQCLRAERENCCDDLATELVGGDPLRLARALTALAEWSQAAVLAPAPRLALAATGGRGSLLGRVRRLVQGPPARPTRGESLAAVALLLGGLGLLGTGVALAVPAALAPAGQRLRQLAPAAAVARQSVVSPADTAKRLAKVPVPPVAPAPPSLPAPVAPEAPEAPPVADAPDAPQEAPDAPQAAPDVSQAPDAPRPPRLRRLRSGQQGPGSTVIIEKDKKGRLTQLIVDGQPVETQDPGKKSKKSKNAQVEVIQIPKTGAWAVEPGGPGSRIQSQVRGWTRGPGVQGFGPGMNAEQQAKLFKEQEKLFKQRDKLFQQQKQMFGQLDNYHQQLNGLALIKPDVHVDLDTDAIERDAVASAKRSLRQSLQSPNLSDDDRRATEQALESLEGGPADGNAHQADRNARRAALNARQAERNARQADLNAAQADRNAARVEADQRRRELQDQFGAPTDDVRERRRELQTQIRDAQRELAVLQREEAAGGDAGSFRGPRVPQAPPAPTSSTKVRDELRHDGLIGAADKSFSFQLNDKGGRVNGRALTPAQFEKYRRQFLPATTGAGKSKSAISINVDER
ncbi:MAG: M56 family metallopeptidase [Janthinobacterium lividum]